MGSIMAACLLKSDTVMAAESNLSTNRQHWLYRQPTVRRSNTIDSLSEQAGSQRRAALRERCQLSVVTKYSY